MKDWFAILLVALSMVEATVAGGKPLTLAKLKNAIYVIDGDAIKLTDGRWEAGHETYELLAESIAFADLDGDGQKEAVAIVLYSPGVSGEFYYLLTIGSQNGEPQVIDAKLLDGRVVFPMSVGRGVISVSYLEDRNGPNKISKQFRLSPEGRLVEVLPP